jgi:hypothetical protein
MLRLKCYKIHIYRVRSTLQVAVDHGWRLEVIMAIVTIVRNFMSMFGYCVHLAGSL